MPNAAVTLTSLDTGIERQFTTTDSGAYTFPNIQPGRYKLGAQAKGFRPLETPEFVLAAYRTIRQDLQFELLASVTEVTVTGNVSTVITTESPALSTSLTSKQILELPTNLRSVFNNAGGAMGQMKLLHCSITEYVILFGTPIGTEGHSGRYGTEVYDFMLDGEMWCYHPGEFERAIYKPGDAAYLGPDKAKGYAVPSHAWMLEYSRGIIPTMLPFGLADTVFSTLDRKTVGRTLWQYGKLVVKELAQGKV